MYIKHLATKNRVKNPTYKTWDNMKTRCYNKSHNKWTWYGGKGITICNRWLGSKGYINFLADMGEKPSSKHSIDRINPKLGYKPNNCRWLLLSINRKWGNK